MSIFFPADGAAELQKRKKLAPSNFLTQNISSKTRDLRHFQIRDKIAYKAFKLSIYAQSSVYFSHQLFYHPMLTGVSSTSATSNVL